jgi:flagellin
MGFAANLAAIVDADVAKGFNQKMLDANLNGISGDFATTSGSLILSKTAGVSITTMDAASAALSTIDAALETIALQRANLGSESNRLDSTVSNLTNISSNLQAGRGRIEDADFASETTSLAKSQILQQASTAMLAQANASKQNVLSLLQG